MYSLPMLADSEVALQFIFQPHRIWLLLAFVQDEWREPFPLCIHRLRQIALNSVSRLNYPPHMAWS